MNRFIHRGLCASISLGIAIFASAGSGAFAQGTGYGVAGGDLYSLNLSNGTSALVTSSLAFSNTNGLATDGDNNILYYSQHDTFNVGYWDITNSLAGTVGNLTAFNANLINPLGVRGAGWYNGGYYFIDIGTDDLYRADLSTTGISSVNKVADISNNSTAFTMGDMVIDQSGLLYASFFGAFELATYDLTNNTLTTYSGSVSGVNGGLSLGNDGNLYGTSGATTDLTKVTLAGGNATGSVVGSAVPTNMKDISSDVSATTIVPEPSSLALLVFGGLGLARRKRGVRSKC